MKRSVLSPEEYDFFSLPLGHAISSREVFPVRRIVPDLSHFLQMLPVRICALICSNPDTMEVTLGLLHEATRQREELLCMTCDPGLELQYTDSVSDIFHVLPLCSVPAFVPESSEAERIRHIHLLPASAMTSEKMQEFTKELFAPENKKKHTLLLMLCGNLAPLLVAEVMALYPATVIDGTVFFEQAGFYDYCTFRETGPQQDSLVRTLQDYHRLKQKSAFLESMLDQLELPVVAGYANGSLLGANQSLLRFSGYKHHELLALTLSDLVCEDYEAVLENVFISLLHTGRTQELQVEAKSASGVASLCRLQLFFHGDPGQPLFFFAIFEPVQPSSPVELATVTSRQQFLNRLQFALLRSARQREYAFAVLVMGIDNHAHLLEKIESRNLRDFYANLTKRIGSCLRNLDVPSHLDPEHFSILLDDVTDVIGAVRVAQRIQEETRKPFRLDQQEVLITCSFGVVLAPFSYEHPEDILRDAHTALSRALQRGERQTVVFDDRQNNRAMQYFRIESELKDALRDNEVRMFYQPILDVRTGAMRGVEAFMRWDHKRQGLVRAERFLPFAEYSDIMFELEAWAIRETCTTFARLREQSGKDFFLGLNVSLKNMLRIGFLEELLEVIRVSRLDPRMVLLEVREEWLPQFAERFPVLLQQIRDSGFGVVLDHFDAAKTSLLDLHHLPLRGVKIASSLLQDEHVVGSLVAVAKSAGLCVHVPGLEHREQMTSIRKLDCDFVQGDFIAPAMNAENILQYAAKAVIALEPNSIEG